MMWVPRNWVRNFPFLLLLVYGKVAHLLNEESVWLCGISNGSSVALLYVKKMVESVKR